MKAKNDPDGGRLRHIALSAGSYDGGGIGIALIYLAQGLLGRGHAVDLLEIAGTSTDRDIPQDANLVHLGQSGRRGLVPMMRYFRRAKPDVVLVARDYIGLITDLALRLSGRRHKTKLIWTFHTAVAQDVQYASFYKRILMRLARRSMRKSDVLIGVSEGVSSEVRAMLDLAEGDILTLPNAVWTQERLDAAMAVPPVAEGKKRVLCCARLEPQKDLHVLIEAFANLPADIDCELLIAGDGSVRGALEAQIAEAGLEGRITLLGYQPDCLGWMASADCLALSSRYEGAPVVLVEGLAMGAPIVSTDCPAGPNEILQGGKLGRLTPVGDVKAFSSAMLACLLGDEKTDAARALRKEGAEAYRADIVAARYEALIDTLDTAQTRS